MKYIKNISGGPLTIEGQLINNNEYYQIQVTEDSKYASSSDLISYIASSSALMARTSDGLFDITDVNEAIDFLKNLSPLSIVSSPFASKTLPSGKKLYTRKHGVAGSEVVPSATVVTTYTVPYSECKLTVVDVIGGQEGDTVNLKILDTATGTMTSVPNYVLNQFGFDVYISGGVHREKSQYEADLFLGLQIELIYTNNGAMAVTPNFNITLHEVKD